MTPCTRVSWVVFTTTLCLLFAGALPARADDAPSGKAGGNVGDVFGGLGTAKSQGSEAPMRPGEGRVVGRVLDAELGTPVRGATVILIFPTPAVGGEAPQQVQVTDSDGSYEFDGVPAGTYTLSFVKSGYRASNITSFAVQAGEENRADFPMPPLPAGTGEEVLELEPFVVEAAAVGKLMTALQLRMQSDLQLNIMSAEDLSKYAASDVGDALKRVAGVNVVQGKFAIIRGLEDRYSSTLFNSASIPSPDPDRQSVQLDLFPSEVVSNLSVAKTFAPDLPGNSAGGSIDIVGDAYPDKAISVKVSSAAGFNSNATDHFLTQEKNNPVGVTDPNLLPIDADVSAALGGRNKILDREVRFQGVAAWKRDYETDFGFTEKLEPRPAVTKLFPKPPHITRPGDLSLGTLSLSDGRYDLTESYKDLQQTGYGGLGFDLDPAGHHKIDLRGFYTQKEEQWVRSKQNGYLPNADYAHLTTLQGNDPSTNLSFTNFDAFATRTSWLRVGSGARENPGGPASKGPLWYTNFNDSSSGKTRRELLLGQINGDHSVDLDFLGKLHATWALNYANTKQDEEQIRMQYFYEPVNKLPVPKFFPAMPFELGPGRYTSNDKIHQSLNTINEDQYFARVDADYDKALFESAFEAKISGGYWYETSKRDVGAGFLENPSINSNFEFALPSQVGNTPVELGRSVTFYLDNANGEISGTRQNVNKSSREIEAYYAEGKATFWKDLDLLGGVRREHIFIESLNDPFIPGQTFFGAPAIYPTQYLFFDRLDNAARKEWVDKPPFNDQILGINVPVDPQTGLVDLTTRQQIESLVNGTIDEVRYLPAAGLTYRPVDGLSLRASYSQTVARPSFREMGYYVTVNRDDELVVGNPQLQLSDVESYDGRAEYTWGEQGDLAAFSGFYKTIQKPIESIVLRNPQNKSTNAGDEALYRTYFNNQNLARLWGVEAEARKNLGFLGFGPLGFTRYFSVGGNFTWIEARVARSQAEIDRTQTFFGVPKGYVPHFTEYAKTRRLFGQPQWIANADITFDQHDWGTKATIAFFAISDVLDAAGSATAGPNGTIVSMTLDRYIDSYYQLDLILSQTLHVDWLRGDVTVKLSAKNLTDSLRQIIYDPYQTIFHYPQRSYRVGRKFKLTLSYAF